MSDYFDPDDIAKANYTPPLRKVSPIYQSAETPPPLVPEDTSPSSAGTNRSRVVRNGVRTASGKNFSGRRKTRPSECDTVLINQLANHNQPELATRCGVEPLESASQSEAEEEEGVYQRVYEEEADRHQMPGIRNGENATHRMSNKVMAIQATEALKRAILANQDIEMRDPSESISDEGDKKSESSATIRKEPETRQRYEAMQVTSPPPRVPLDVKPPPRTAPPLAPITTQNFSPRQGHEDEGDSIATSPTLAKFAITPAYGDPDSTLPAMQKSPPRSSSGQSPESMQTLPSLKAALSQVNDNSNNGLSRYPSAASQSPSMTRTSPTHHGQFVPTPSSYSQPSPRMSPPGLPHTSGMYGWRSTPRENSGSTTTPSDYQSTPSSALTSQSSANGYPTPKALDQNGSVNDNSSVNGSPTSMNGVASSSSSFRCTYPGCTAAPFQTQYLLNSHANVHSSSRPHFCPVENCPRGPGGKGFKRKNEMIRHGLVHESPGYQCPFCPDQTHKYPRPDNLQRHVRVHHLDKDRDDPLLRQVLAQRPEGGNRGRRRRI